MSYPRPNNPDDESDLPWNEDEEIWDDEELNEPVIPYVDFTDIPAWQKTHRFALRIAQLSRTAPAEHQRHPALVNLRRQSYLAAVDIAYGHDEGYGTGKLQRHLDRCCRGLKRIHLCLSLLETVQKLGILSPPSQRALFDQTIKVRDGLVHWMEQLRRY